MGFYLNMVKTVRPLWPLSNIFQTTACVAFFHASSDSPRLGCPSNKAPIPPPPPHFLLTTVSTYDLAPMDYSAPSTPPPPALLRQSRSVAALSVWASSLSKRCFLLGAPAASGVTHYCMRGGTCDLFNYSALHFYPTIPNATREIDCLKDPSL